MDLFPVVLVAFLSHSCAEVQGLDQDDRDNMTVILSTTLFGVFAVIIFIILFNLHRLFCCHDDHTNQQKLHYTEAIDECPVLVYSTAKDQLQTRKGAEECAVCLVEFEDRDTIKMLPKCRHVFHHHCIDTWLLSRMNCPICRQKLTSGTVVDIDITRTTEQEQQELVTESEVAVNAREQPEPESLAGHEEDVSGVGQVHSGLCP